jgi:hypothetical protein
VLVVTLVTAVLESYAIIVLDNTEQQQGVTRRRPPLLMSGTLHQELSAAESTRADVKAQGFRSTVIHKPASVNGPGGLTVQDPPKGWPFSEVHVNLNSHIPENEAKGLPRIIIPRPDESRIKQYQQQQIQHQRTDKQFIQQHKSGHNQQLHHEQRSLIHPQHPVQQQNLQQKPEQAAATGTNNSGQLTRKLKQPVPYIIAANGNQQLGVARGNDDHETINEPSENIPVTRASNSDVHTGYNFKLIPPPDTSANSNQMLSVIKQEVSTSGPRSSAEDVSGLNGNKQQQNSSPFVDVEPKSSQNQAVRQHNEVGTSTNYVWRDVSPGLQISSNTPQLPVGSHQSPTAAQEPLAATADFKKEEHESSLSGKSATTNVGVQSGANVQGVHVSNFDHASALGHSANFGYRDAVASLPSHLQTGGQHANQEHAVTRSQDQAAGEQEQNTRYKSSDHEITHNSPPGAGKSGMHMDTVLGRINENHGNAHAVYNHGGQYNQQQPQIYSLMPQASYSVVPTNQKVLTINTGLVQGAPGALILGNGLHAGHQDILFSGQGMVNAGGHAAPVQALYIPMPVFQGSQLGNYHAQKGTVGGHHVGHLQQNPPVLLNSHVGEGIISIAPMPYLGLINGGLYGHTGIGGLHLLQGNMLGMPGLNRGTSLHGGQIGGMLFGGNHFLSSNGGLATDSQSNLAHQDYASALQFETQAAGQQQHSANRHVPVAAGGNLPNASPHQQQQVNHQHGLAPQINVHPHGFGMSIVQQHPVPQRGFKTGGYSGLPVGRHRFPQQPSGFPAYGHAVGVPDRGYQTFSVASQLHEPVLTTSSHPSGFKLNTVHTHIPFATEQEMPQLQAAVKRDGSLSKPISVPDLGTQLGDKTARGWPKRYISANSETPSSPTSNYVFPTNSRFVMGLKSPAASHGFIK